MEMRWVAHGDDSPHITPLGLSVHSAGAEEKQALIAHFGMHRLCGSIMVHKPPYQLAKAISSSRGPVAELLPTNPLLFTNSKHSLHQL